MTFDESIAYIKSLDIYGSVLGLENMRALCSELDNPQDGLKFVHVTGTNGKGSVCAFLSNILLDAGYKVGSYNSPAVLSDIDQYRLNMEIISEELYAEAVSLVRDACERIVASGGNQATRFEVETMVAFTAFYIEKCDIVVLETGLGGELDATNVIANTLLHVFTSISLDHSAVLGSTIEEISKVKSGIIKTSAPVLVYGNNPIIRERATEMDADLYTVSDDDISNIHMECGRVFFDLRDPEFRDIELSMPGAYQPYNASVAIKAATILTNIGFKISKKNIRHGIKKAIIPFRLEVVKYGVVDIILDGAHNPDGANQFMKSLSLLCGDREAVFLTGIFKDKDYEEIAKITGGRASKIFAIQNTKSERSLDKNTLAKCLLKYNASVETEDSIESALKKAISYAQDKICDDMTHPVVACFGSLSWLNEARVIIDSIKEVQNIKSTGESTVDSNKIKQGIQLILEGIGEDLSREGLKDTPDRVARMYEEIFSGLNNTAETELSKTFSSDAKEMVIEKDITFYSMCEHHLMPFYGKAHIAYIPDGRVVGISKLARCVEVYAKKPQIQERLTEEIADAIMTYLKPKGVLVMLEAEHMCMTMRGVKKPGTKTVTMAAKGKMQKKENKDMFFELLNR